MNETPEQKTLRIAEEIWPGATTNSDDLCQTSFRNGILEFARRLLAEQGEPVKNGITFDGYADEDERFAYTIEEYTDQLNVEPIDEVVKIGDEFTVSACFSREETWRVLSLATMLAPNSITRCERIAPTMTTQAESPFVLTRNEANEAVALTRQDEEGRIVEVLWERPEQDALDGMVRAQLMEKMVDAFLSWPLPSTFAPDGGISFDGSWVDARGALVSWPIGTNLFTAREARLMVEHMFAVADAAMNKEPTK